MVTYKILQIKDIAACDYAFRSYDPNKFNLTDYVVKYTDQFDLKKAEREGLTNTDICEALFVKFNYNRPTDFTGHSLSLSDLVQIKDKVYYCDLTGWTRVK